MQILQIKAGEKSMWIYIFWENRNTKDISLPSKIFHAFDLEVDQQKEIYFVLFLRETSLSPFLQEKFFLEFCAIFSHTNTEV